MWNVEKVKPDVKKNMAVFTQIVILIMVLSCMVMVLLAIRQLTKFESFDDAEETDHLKEEIEKDGNIISTNNIFSTLVEAEKDKNLHDNLNEK